MPKTGPARVAIRSWSKLHGDKSQQFRSLLVHLHVACTFKPFRIRALGATKPATVYRHFSHFSIPSRLEKTGIENLYPVVHPEKADSRDSDPWQWICVHVQATAGNTTKLIEMTGFKLICEDFFGKAHFLCAVIAHIENRIHRNPSFLECVASIK